MPAGMPSQKITGIRAEKTCTNYLIVTAPRIATRSGVRDSFLCLQAKPIFSGKMTAGIRSVEEAL
jgi:hypothetical protein